jgi:hypothetical protein
VFIALPLVVLLHLLLTLLLLAGLRVAPVTSTAPAVQVLLEPAPVQRPPPPPPLPRLARPGNVEATVPTIDIALPPPVAVVPSGATGMASGQGVGGAGKGGAAAPVSQAAPPPADPNCETLDAYTGRVRSAINRYFEYSELAREARIQGTVMVHFLSSPQGRITASTITASRIERMGTGVRRGGHTQRLGVAFTRIGDLRWRWQAVMHDDAGADTPLGSGMVGAEDDDGLVHSPDRADDTLQLELPESLHAAVPRLTLHLGHAAQMFLLEKSVLRTLARAQPLPQIPSCLKLARFNAVMPFGFELQAVR